MIYRSLAVLTFLLAVPMPAHSQQATHPDYRSGVHLNWGEPTVTMPADSIRRVTSEALAWGGLLGWGAGLVAGGMAGYALHPRSDTESWVGATEWWIGAAVGSSVGAAAGVHLTNGAHGNLLLSSLGSVVTLPFVLFLGTAVGPAVIVAVPAAQILVSMMIERATSPEPDS
jgi:hypothetical protein